MGLGMVLVAAASAVIAQPDQRTNELLGAKASPTVATFTAAEPSHVNGRLHVTRPIRGGERVQRPAHAETEAYGAYGDERRRARARVGHVQITIDPWTPITAEGLQSRERMRVQWLKREGYVGGVRTIVSDRRTVAVEGAEKAESPAPTPTHPEPILRLRIPDGVRTEPNRYRVHLPPGLEGADRVVIPDGPVSQSADRVAEADDSEIAVAACDCDRAERSRAAAGEA